MIVDIIIIIISILALWKGADWLVDSASRIGKKVGLSDLVIGLTVVAFGTSAPEFAVTIAAALKGQTDISVGNVVGSNIFNLGFILGGVAAVKTISTSRLLVYRDGFILIASTILLKIFVIDMNISSLEGGIMIALLCGYTGYLLWKKDFSPDTGTTISQATWLDGILLLVGLAMVVGGGHFLVESAANVARAFNISEWVIGVTIVAAGTSAPELATSLVAVLKNRYGISLGNLIGSNIFNILGVLGVATLLNPKMTVDPQIITNVNLLIIISLVVIIFTRTGWKVSRFEGILLILANLLYWIASYIGF